MKIPLFPARGLRLRLTLLFGAILGLTLLVFSLLVYGAFVREQDLQFDAALYNHAVDVSSSIEINPYGAIFLGTDGVTAGGKIFPFAVGKSFIQILNHRGGIIARSKSLGQGTLPFSDTERALLSAQGVAIRTISRSELGLARGKSDPRYRLISFLVQSSRLSSVVLQIGVSLKPMEDERRGLRTFFTVAIPVTLLLSMLSALYLSGKALAPVGAIIAKTRQLSASRLDQRLPIPPDEDELRLLSETLNDLLDRLEKAFNSQERFIADASHQLKTPLAIIRGELDVLGQKPNRTQSEIAEFLESARQEIDHLTRLVEDLLLLARVDAGAGSLLLSNCRLDEIVIEVTSKMEKLARRKNIRLKLDLRPDDGGDPERKDFEVRGDPDLLQSALQNLVDNAIKYTPPNGVIEISISENKKLVKVMVKDSGEGISNELRPLIFDRFFRGKEGKNVGKTTGFGLGLAIAFRILEAHGSTLTLDSPPHEGSTFAFEMNKV